MSIESGKVRDYSLLCQFKFPVIFSRKEIKTINFETVFTIVNFIKNAVTILDNENFAKYLFHC